MRAKDDGTASAPVFYSLFEVHDIREGGCDLNRITVVRDITDITVHNHRIYYIVNYGYPPDVFRDICLHFVFLPLMSFFINHFYLIKREAFLHY